MVQMIRKSFYRCLIEGTPDTCDNDRYFHQFKAEAREGFGWLGRQGLAVLPFRIRQLPSQEWIPLQRKIGPEGQDGFIGDPELFPAIVSAALFESEPTTGDTEKNEGSALTVIWFQHNALVVLEDEPLAWLRQLKWDNLAYDFTN